MIFRRSTPSVLRSFGFVLEYAYLEDDSIMGVYKDFFAITRLDAQPSEASIYEWTDIASVRWEQPKRQLLISFVDSSAPVLTVQLRQEQSDNIAPLVHERVDSSFFWRQRRKLPSGTEAVFMIRSGKDSRLSIQTLYDKPPSEQDGDFIESMHERMRDLAGLT